MKTLIKWTALAVVVAAVLVIAREPLYWLRRLNLPVHASGELPQSSYAPRVVVQGGNQPPAPR